MATFDVNDSAHLLIVKEEYTNDPQSIGYAGANETTEEILKLFNAPASNTTGATVGVPFDEYPLYEAITEVDNAEYQALAEFDKEVIKGIICAGLFQPDLTFAHAKKAFRQAFGTESTTWSELERLVTGKSKDSHERWIVGELDGVRVYISGNNYILTKQDLYG